MTLDSANATALKLIQEHRIKLNGRIIRLRQKLQELEEQLRQHDLLFAPVEEEKKKTK